MQRQDEAGVNDLAEGRPMFAEVFIWEPLGYRGQAERL
jgi:hypothetical protein